MLESQTYSGLAGLFTGPKGSNDYLIRSAITKYRKWRNCEPDDPLSREWSDDAQWELQLKAFSSYLAGTVATQTLRTMRSNLNKARNSLAKGVPVLDPSAFASRLRATRKALGLTQTELVERLSNQSVRISRKQISDYELAKRRPSHSEQIAALEKALELAHGSLGGVAYRRDIRTAATAPVYSGTYGAKIAERKKRDDWVYAVTMEQIATENPTLFSFWRKIVDFRTQEIIDPSRMRKRRWATATVNMAERSFLGFVGFLQKVQPLARIHILDGIDASLMRQFMSFLKERNDTYNSAVRNLSILWNPLLHPRNGFFPVWWDLFLEDPVAQSRCGFKHTKRTQSDRVMFERIFEEHFRKYCESARQKLSHLALQGSEADSGRLSRDVQENLKEILDSPKPVEYLFRLADGLRNDSTFHAGANSLILAAQSRDLAAIELSIRIPLRIRTLVRWLSWREDNTGTFRKDPKGGYQIILPPEAFKNINGAASKGYKVPVPESVAKLITEYITKWRDIHINRPDFRELALEDIRRNEPISRVPVPDPSDRLFGFSQAAEASRRLAVLTARYVGILFRFHSFRHIVATDFLKRFPQHHIALAHLLNDTLEVVLKHYAKKDEGQTVLMYHRCLDEDRSARRAA